MKSSVICSVAVAAAFVVWVSPVALALDKTPVLSLDLAKKIAAGCETKAKEMSWKMNISVVDSGANQIFFEKMDGAYLGSGDIALHKAQTSARFPFPTRGIEQLAYGKDLKGGTVPGLALATVASFSNVSMRSCILAAFSFNANAVSFACVASD